MSRSFLEPAAVAALVVERFAAAQSQPSDDGSLLRLDAHGNVEGCAPSPYLVIPVAQS